MKKYEINNILDLIDKYELILFDLWGVLIEGGKIKPDVISVVNHIISRKKVAFVSNVPHTASFMHKRMVAFGIKAEEHMLVTSGQYAHDILANTSELGIYDPFVYHLGRLTHENVLQDLDIEIVSDLERANIMFLTFSSYDGAQMQYAKYMLGVAAEKNVIVICANPDIVLNDMGRPYYCAGYFAEFYKTLGGKVIYTGKPKRRIFLQALKINNVTDTTKVLMIGDTLDTDILGAQKVGIDSGLVLTGNMKGLIDPDNLSSSVQKITAPKNIWPTYLVTLV